MKKSKWLFIVLSFFMLILTSCYKSDGANLTDKNAPTPKPTVKINNNKTNVTKEALNLTVWQAYWNNDELTQEMEILKDSIKNVIHFAAYFNAENELFIPEGIIGVHLSDEANPKDGYKHYLSFVNDKILSDGTSSLKDTKLLYELFKDTSAMDNHINSICNMVVENGYDGIEVDYEAIKKDFKLWKLYLNFIQKLYNKTKELNLEMRVILEPAAPLEEIKAGKLKFPTGPEYVMMCYNLHGNGSEPGAKADKAFIISLAKKMKSLKGKINFAFATGGFDWKDDNSVASLTESEAITLQKNYVKNPVRDIKSSALTFSYTDISGSKHNVWYADGTTLKKWIETANDYGINSYSLWRLNGNEDSSLLLVNELMLSK
ncbi:MAG: hypothetical protein K0S61_857 [Anaerocolumna sp.]|nr:hypothetical protein [Anaerocolumna sp.]